MGQLNQLKKLTSSALFLARNTEYVRMTEHYEGLPLLRIPQTETAIDLIKVNQLLLELGNRIYYAACTLKYVQEYTIQKLAGEARQAITKLSIELSALHAGKQYSTLKTVPIDLHNVCRGDSNAGTRKGIEVLCVLIVKTLLPHTARHNSLLSKTYAPIVTLLGEVYTLVASGTVHDDMDECCEQFDRALRPLSEAWVSEPTFRLPIESINYTGTPTSVVNMLTPYVKDITTTGYLRGHLGKFGNILAIAKNECCSTDKESWFLMR